MTKADKEGQRKAPILRFKGFTDDWEQRKLGKVIERRTQKREFSDLPYIEYADIIPNIGRLNKDIFSRKNTKQGIYFQKNDILFGKLRPYLNNWLKPQFEGIAVGDFWILNGIKLNNDFLYYYIQTKKFSDVANVTTGTKMPRSDWNLVSNLKIKFPNFEEQQNIGKLFYSLENLITLYEMKKQLLTQLKQGIVNFLITKNGQKPQLRFSGFNNNWESKSFEKLLNYEQPTKYIVKKADYISQGTPVLTANKSFILGYTNETNVYQNIPAIIFDDFTLESKYVDFPFMVKSSAIKILTSKNSNLFFIYQLLNNQKFVQEGHSRHYISVVQKKKVLVPSIQEQNKIGNLIKQLKNSIEQNSDIIALLKSLKEFLLQNMFL